MFHSNSKNVMKNVLFILMAGMLVLGSCMNKWDTLEVDNNGFTAENIAEPNTTIKAIRKTYANEIANNSYTLITTDQIIEGIVVANDISGNIYQFIYIQGIAEDGTVDTTEGGIGVGIKNLLANLYTIFPVGQKVRINLNGLYVGGYGASPRIGYPYINTNGAMRMGPMSSTFMKTNIQKIGKPDTSKVKARVINASDLNANNVSTLTPMLVVMKNSTIADTGWPYAHWEVGGDTYSEYHDIAIDGKNVKQLLYTSTSATFAGDSIQPGKKTIYGLLNRYSSSYQLSLRSIEDIVEEGK